MDGNQRFVSGNLAEKDFAAQRKATTNGQQPFAAVLTCIDSRVIPELIFDTGIGDIFTVRVAGNVVNDDVLGSLEFACNVTGSQLIVVMGHTNCGAVQSALRQVEMGHITPILEKIKPAIAKIGEPKGSQESWEAQVTAENVNESILRLRMDSPILNQLEQNGMIKIAGTLYNISNGAVQVLP